MRFYGKDGQYVKGATLRDAKRDGLFVSVSTIIGGAVRKPGIEYWKEDLLIEIAMNASPIFAAHEEDEFKKYVKSKMAQTIAKPASKGTQYHKDLAAYFKDGEDPKKMPLELLNRITDKLYKHDIVVNEVEVPFVNSDAMVGGTIDAICEDNDCGIILDWKTQFYKGPTPKCYTTWAMQLAAYNLYYDKAHDFKIANVVIPANDDFEEYDVTLKFWDRVEDHENAFRNAHELWKYMHEFGDYESV